jgi:hypothetical protein
MTKDTYTVLISYTGPEPTDNFSMPALHGLTAQQVEAARARGERQRRPEQKIHIATSKE